MQAGGVIGRMARWVFGAGLLWIVWHHFFGLEGGMSEFNFYEQRVYYCAACGTATLWLRRVDDGMVLLHPNTSCELSGKTFHPPSLPLVEIKGRVADGQFVPEGVLTTKPHIQNPQPPHTNIGQGGCE